MITRLTGKSRAWYYAALAVLLIAAVFCVCAAVSCVCAEGGKDIKPEDGTFNDLEITDAGSIDEAPAATDAGEKDQTSGTWEGLSAETEKRILQDYYDTFKIPVKDKDKITICGYYGTYNGCVVVSFKTPYGAAGIAWGASIAGIWFVCGDLSKVPLVWKDGLFYTGDRDDGGLQKAYDLGLLTQDDLRNIAELFNIPGTWEGLSAETAKRVLQDYYDTFNIPVKDKGQITISGYYGTYNGCVVVSIKTPYGAVGIGWSVFIAGIKFFCSDYQKVPLVWKDGLFYTGTGGRDGVGLQKAYDLGLLTQDDLRNIAELFNP